MLHEGATSTPARVPRYDGLRFTADEYLALPDDGFRYEVIDGVAVMSPSPMPNHQDVGFELAGQVWLHLKDHPVGRMFFDTDVRFGPDLVYRPDMVFIRADRVREPLPRIDIVPDLVVEVLSPSSEPRDRRTKFEDYQRFGVLEYWIVDPRRKRIQFYRLVNGVYAEVPHVTTTFTSEALPGFTLDLRPVLAKMRP